MQGVVYVLKYLNDGYIGICICKFYNANEENFIAANFAVMRWVAVKLFVAHFLSTSFPFD